MLQNAVTDHHPFEWLKIMRERIPGVVVGAIVFYKAINKREVNLWVRHYGQG